MIPVKNRRFGAVVHWRSWLLGFQFGPEVWEIHLGPLTLWFDPEGIHDPDYSRDAMPDGET